MSYIKYTKRSTSPSTPAANKLTTWLDTYASPHAQMKMIDESGNVIAPWQVDQASTANQTGFAADAYLTGSKITFPALPKVSTTYRCVFDMVKTGAGTATPIIIVRIGTAGTTSDTARLTFTFAAGTAAIDTGIFEIFITFRSIGASGVITGLCRCTHHLAATGLISTGASGTGILTVTSASFDTTVASSVIGVSFNGGTSFAGTNTLVYSEGWGF